MPSNYTVDRLAYARASACIREVSEIVLTVDPAESELIVAELMRATNRLALTLGASRRVAQSAAKAA